MFVSFKQFTDDLKMWKHRVLDISSYNISEDTIIYWNKNKVESLLLKDASPDHVFVKIIGRKDTVSVELDAVHCWEVYKLQKVY